MNNLSPMIDEYAETKAAIGRLELKKKELEAALADLKAGAYESDNFRLTISDTVLESYDEVIKAEIKLVTDGLINGMSRQYLTAHTVSKPSRRHLVGLPTGKNLAA